MKAYITAFILFISIPSSAQDENGPPDDFVLDECPELIHCLTSAETYDGYIPWSDLLVGNVGNCEGTLFSQMNFGFEATSTEMDIEVTWETDDFVKSGVVNNCVYYPSCLGNASCDDGGVLSYTAENLAVGRFYILYVDGCNNYEIPFEATVTPEGSEDFTAIDNFHLKRKYACSSELEENSFCANAVLTPQLSGPSESDLTYFLNAEIQWRLILDGPYSEIIELDNLSDLELELDTPGDYVITLEHMQTNCSFFSLNLQFEFSIVDFKEEFGRYTVCDHDLIDWNPENGWRGDDFNSPGFYEYNYLDNCGCNRYQSIEILEYEEHYVEQELVLCPDDYPYDFFYFELEYFDSDYDIMLRVEEESLIEDYSGSSCDSLIHLYVVNENPEERCSSCDLPLSLEQSKIVYCIPFDNGSYDVSGKSNRVIAEGISYDNNGPASNALWEAVFDGDNDYVYLPHIEDLNTSGFAIDFRFNKDERFSNGDTEVLISKGDFSKNNMRFSFEIQRSSENSFDFIAKFFSPNSSQEIVIPDLSRNLWYGITAVVEEDQISIYKDGLLYQNLPITESLIGNDHDLYIGIQEDADQKIKAFEGRVDDFKYWKQKLSGQDILYLYFPWKEFEVEYSYFLTCCEQAYFNDIVISKENPLDSFVVEQASVRGYDSVYILKYIEVQNGPEINLEVLPEDIQIAVEYLCNETCQYSYAWDINVNELFIDICGIDVVDVSHQSPIQLDQENNVIELVYLAQNNCGYVEEASFRVELECVEQDFTQLPNSIAFGITDGNNCIHEEDDYCINQDLMLSIEQLFNEQLESIDINNYEVLQLDYAVNDAYYQLDLKASFSGHLSFENPGDYKICLTSISSECDTKSLNDCFDLTIYDTRLTDYGKFRACNGLVDEVIPSSIPDQIRAEFELINQSGTYNISAINDCGCMENHTIELEVWPQDQEILNLELCEEDFPIMIFDSIFEDPIQIEEEFLLFAGQSKRLDSNGNNCDSLILLTLNIHERYSQYIEETICEGDSLMGLYDSGQYEFIYDSQMGCDSLVILDLTVLDETHPDCLVSSLEYIDSDLLLYPNPADDFISIGSNAQQLSKSKVLIYSTTGHLVSQQTYSGDRIEITHLHSGIYYMKIESQNKSVVHKFYKL